MMFDSMARTAARYQADRNGTVIVGNLTHFSVPAADLMGEEIRNSLLTLLHIVRSSDDSQDADIGTYRPKLICDLGRRVLQNVNDALDVSVAGDHGDSGTCQIDVNSLLSRVLTLVEATASRRNVSVYIAHQTKMPIYEDNVKMLMATLTRLMLIAIENADRDSNIEVRLRCVASKHISLNLRLKKSTSNTIQLASLLAKRWIKLPNLNEIAIRSRKTHSTQFISILLSNLRGA